MSGPNEGDVVYISADGQVVTSAQEAVEVSQTFEGSSGQYVTGGNCPQDPQNVPDGK